jgi:hypothetical protein
LGKWGDKITTVQTTFSEKGTKITSQLHISKFEILIFFYKNKTFQSFFSSEKCVTSHWRQKVTVFMDFFWEKLRISSFEMWIWDVIFIPFSEKAINKTAVFAVKNLRQEYSVFLAQPPL